MSRSVSSPPPADPRAIPPGQIPTSARATLAWLCLVTLAIPAFVAAAPNGKSMSPHRGGTFRIIQEQVTTLDPKEIDDTYSATVTKQIHNGLLTYSTNLTPIPDIARSWIISRDGLVYTLELNRNVKFHNGRELTTGDVVYTFERIFRPGSNPGVAGQFLSVIRGTSEFHEGRAKTISGIETLGRYTLRITLSNPDATFLWALALNNSAIVPREVIERLGDEGFARNPVGCGPFRFVSNDNGVIRLCAFEDYFHPRANLDSLVFLTPKNYLITDGVTALLEGRCDMAEIPGFKRAEISRTPGFKLVSRRELTLSFIALNVTMKPLDNPHVRRALALSVDRQAAIDLNPAGQIASTAILPPGIPCYSPEVRVFPFDPAGAREELRLAGYPGGRGLPEIVFHTSRHTGRAKQVDSLMIANWRSAGLNVRVTENTWPELNKGLEDYTMPLFSLSWVADLPDPDSFLGTLFHSGSPSNYSRYANAAADSLILKARRTIDISTRTALYRRAEKIILNDAPVIPLYTSTTAFGLRQAVRGLELTPLGISCVDMAHIWFEDSDRAEAQPR